MMENPGFSDLSQMTHSVAKESWIDETRRQEVFYESTTLGLTFMDQRRRQRTRLMNACAVENAMRKASR